MAIIPDDLENHCYEQSSDDTLNQSKKTNRRRRRCRRSRSNRKNNESSDDGGSMSDSSSSFTRNHHQQQQHKRSTNQRKAKQTPKKNAQLSEAEKALFVAMDCEMVGVGQDGLKSAVARVTCVDYHHNILLDILVRPDQPVTDYRTHVSGITAQHLEAESAVDLETARSQVAQLLTPDTILVGHALKNDMRLLKLHHPWQNIRDTAKYEPFMKVRFPDDGILWPRKLKELCHEYLELDIQTDGRPHSAYEDAVAALELYKSVASKWEKVMTYKISKTEQILQLQQQNSSTEDESVSASSASTSTHC